MRDLLAAGSSLGGARPKASVRDEKGFLCVAKFPKVDESAVDDVCAWEHVALRLMERSGIPVPVSRLLRVGGRSILLTRRFDRRGSERIPYISGLTAVQGTDGDRYSYLEARRLHRRGGIAAARGSQRPLDAGALLVRRRQHRQPPEELRISSGVIWMEAFSRV